MTPHTPQPGGRIWAISAAAVVVVGVVVALIVTNGPDDPNRPSDGGGADATESARNDDAPDAPRKPREPVTLTPPLRAAILACDALRAQIPVSGGEPTFRATGDLTLTQEIPHADGSAELTVRAGAEVRPAPGAPACPTTLDLQVWIDAAGRVFDVRTLGTRDADTADLERLLDGLK